MKAQRATRADSLLIPLLAAAALWGAGPACGVELPPYACGSQYVAQHADELPLPRSKPARIRQLPESIQAGTELDFLVAGDMYLRTGTCQYVGEHCYIFVEDSQWDTNGGSIFQSHVDGLGELFDRATPADPERGMYALETETFGDPGDVDGHERIFIFVLELEDARLVGFFDRRVATFTDPALRRDVVYLDAGYLRKRPYLAHGTLAHEFQHLIHFAHDPEEETWINEGLSGYAEALTGFPETDTSMVDAFLAQPDFNLTFWPTSVTAANYGATYLFAAFLGERYGPELIRALVAEPRHGTFGIDAALSTEGWADDFASVWSDWIVANYASDDGVYGYAALQGRRIRTYVPPSLPFERVEGVVARRWGTTGVVISAPDTTARNIAVHFDGEDNGRFRVSAYAMRGAARQVTQVDLNPACEGSVQVEDVDSVAVLIGRTSQLGGSFWLSAETFSSTAVAEAEPDVQPSAAALGAAFPNPFNGSTVIPVTLGVAAPVRLSVANLLGQEVAVLLRGLIPAGKHRLTWDGRDARGQALGSGLYVVRLEAGSFSQTRKITRAQ